MDIRFEHQEWLVTPGKPARLAFTVCNDSAIGFDCGYRAVNTRYS